MSAKAAGQNSTVLMICTGNICRSPVAEALWRQEFPGVAVTSAGTDAVVGGQVPLALQRIGKQHGITGLTSHRGAQLEAAAVADAELVLTATTQHRRRVLYLWPQAARRTFTILEFAVLCQLIPQPVTAELPELIRNAETQRRRSTWESAIDVADPYGGPDLAYLQAVQVIGAAISTIGQAWLGGRGAQTS